MKARPSDCGPRSRSEKISLGLSVSRQGASTQNFQLQTRPEDSHFTWVCSGLLYSVNLEIDLARSSMIPFPADKIRDEDSALDWWEAVFARACESLHSQVDAAALVREVIASIRAIRETSLAEPLSLTEAARRYGYSPDHVGRLVRAGKLPNAGRKNAPRVLGRDLVTHRKPKLAPVASKAYDPDTDARSLRVRR